MTLDVLEKVRAGELARVYLMWGDEPILVRELVSAIRTSTLVVGTESLNHDRFSASELESLVQVLQACAQVPMMAQFRLVELWELETLLARKQDADDEASAPSKGSKRKKPEQSPIDRLLTYVSDPNPSTVFVMVASELDARARIVQAVRKAGVLVHFEALRNDADAVTFVLERARRGGISLDRHAASSLVGAVGSSPSDLITALERAELHAGQGLPVHGEDVDAVVAVTREAVIFDLTDAVGAGDHERALAILARMFTANPVRDTNVAFGVHAMLIRQIRLVFTAKMAPGDVEAATGLPPFVARKLARQAERFDERKLRAAYAGLARLDRDLKGGSKLAQKSPHMALQRWILEVCEALPGIERRV